MNKLKRFRSIPGIFIIIYSIFAIITTFVSAELFPYKNPKLPLEERVEDLLSRMTLKEKIAQVSGKDRMDTRQNRRLGIPALKMTDGPHGVGWDRSTCFPTGITMGATWNPVLIRGVGGALGRETRAKGRNVLLGPCICIHRTPLGGRNFESFGEEPYLVARLAVAYVKGVQSQKIGTSTKHYACNNQERDRFTVSVDIGERALREIYLPGFKAAVCEGEGLTVMGAYNKINGSYCCANHHLLSDILKNEWGFKGLVISDWGAVHSTIKTANAGLDLEMPGPGEYFGDKLLKAVKSGKVSEEVLNDKVRRILRAMFLLDLFDGVDPKYRGACDTKGHRMLARKLAEEGIVLLKNENGILPLKKEGIKSIAVIGPNAAEARLGGGGSSTVRPTYSVTPLKGLKKKCGDGVLIHYAKGCNMPGDISILPSTFLIPPSFSKKAHGLKGEYFNNLDLKGKPVLTRIDKKINFDWGNGSPSSIVNKDNFSVRWTGKFVPDESGRYELTLLTDDGCRLYLDNKRIINDWRDHAPEIHRGSIDLKAGRSYDIRIEYYERGGGSVAKLGFVGPGDDLLREAVKIAAKSDVAVVFAGLSWRIEGEGVDKTDMALPGGQDALIKAVAKANKNTIVVLINGTPVMMDRWLNDVPAVVEAWYPGQEGGNAIANILFGKVNPSGKLPVTFPKKLQDDPSHANYPGNNGRVNYAEGIFVGYRHFDKSGIELLFPFGHGLSYTTFKYNNLELKQEDGFIKVSLDLENTGRCTGKEVVQLYLHDCKSSLIRPFKELKAFKKLSLKAGEKKTVQFKLDKTALSFYDPSKKQWIAEPGEFEVLIGSSSRDIRLKDSFTFHKF